MSPPRPRACCSTASLTAPTCSRVVRKSDPRVPLRSGGPPRRPLAMLALHHKAACRHRRAGRNQGALAALLLLALVACERPAPQQPIAKAASVRLRAFVEAAAAGTMVSTGGFLFVATRGGLDRVHHQSGEHLLFGKDNGMPGD